MKRRFTIINGTETIIRIDKYLSPIFFGTNKLWQDELSRDAISEGRNFLSDKISLFC